MHLFLLARLCELCCLTCVGADYAVDSSSADAVVDYFGAGSVSGYYGSCSSGNAFAVVVIVIGMRSWVPSYRQSARFPY